jgi:hypothetical protein
MILTGQRGLCIDLIFWCELTIRKYNLPTILRAGKKLKA